MLCQYIQTNIVSCDIDSRINNDLNLIDFLIGTVQTNIGLICCDNIVIVLSRAVNIIPEVKPVNCVLSCG